MKLPSYRGYDIWLQSGAYVSYIGDIRIGYRMSKAGAHALIDRMLKTGDAYIPYKITNRDTEESIRMDVFRTEIIEEYGTFQRPTPSFVKELAFKRGLFDRSDYKRLSSTRVYL